jgi:cysteine desulfurase
MAYLDHAATTPLRPEAASALLARAGETGNASSLHAAGRRARRVVEESREQIAETLGCRPGDIIFTSGGTEADNLAIKGLFWARQAADPRRRRILASAVEHHAALDPIEWLADSGQASVEWIGVDSLGRVDLGQLRSAIESDPASVALVALMWANNEVGTVQPVAEAAAIAAEHGVPLHTDAVQAAGCPGVDFAASGASALAVSGHKVGGPQGVGLLVLARGLTPVPLQHGGGQERDVRSGTLDVAGIAGLAAAMQASQAGRDAEIAELTRLRLRLIDGVAALGLDATLNGDPASSGRLPGNAHFSFAGCEGDALLLLLDARGVEVSTGSACSAGIAQPSHVLLAMGMSEEIARSSLRFSLGWTSTDGDVDALLAALPGVVERARRAPRLSIR